MVNDKRPNNKYHDNGNTNNIDNDHLYIVKYDDNNNDRSNFVQQQQKWNLNLAVC